SQCLCLRDRAITLDRDALIQHLSLALARLHAHATATRYPPQRLAALRHTAGDHGCAGRVLLPLRGNADPLGRARARVARATGSAAYEAMATARPLDARRRYGRCPDDRAECRRDKRAPTGDARLSFGHCGADHPTDVYADSPDEYRRHP